MRHEIEHIRSDREALRWALGCVRASYLQRMASWNVVQTAAIRWLMAILIVSWASNGVLAARLFCVKMAETCQSPLHGGGADVFFPELKIFPAWSLALAVIASALYVIAAYCLARKKSSSVLILLIGVSLSVLSCGSQFILLAREYGPHYVLGFLSGWLIFLLKFLLVFLLQRGFQSAHRHSNRDHGFKI